jgi:hypothetical protein
MQTKQKSPPNRRLSQAEIESLQAHKKFVGEEADRLMAERETCSKTSPSKADGGKG